MQWLKCLVGMPICRVAVIQQQTHDIEKAEFAATLIGDSSLSTNATLLCTLDIAWPIIRCNLRIQEESFRSNWRTQGTTPVLHAIRSGLGFVALSKPAVAQQLSLNLERSSKNPLCRSKSETSREEASAAWYVQLCIA